MLGSIRLRSALHLSERAGAGVLAVARHVFVWEGQGSGETTSTASAHLVRFSGAVKQHLLIARCVSAR